MPEPLWQFSQQIPRHAFTLRDVARAGDLWRAFQDAAVTGATLAGWPPARFRQEGTSFVVYRQTVVHHRETHYGESLETRTWVSRFKRRTLCTREVRINAGGDRVASATQEWAHVDDQRYKPRQATEETASAFPVFESEPSVELPEFEKGEGSAREWSFEMWQTWSDPLGHANHPAYVDWCDEMLSRTMHEAGVDPIALVPVAERVIFKNPVHPGERVAVKSSYAGVGAAGELVTTHQVSAGGQLSAKATTIRTLAGGEGTALVQLWK